MLQLPCTFLLDYVDSGSVSPLFSGFKSLPLSQRHEVAYLASGTLERDSRKIHTKLSRRFTGVDRQLSLTFSLWMSHGLLSGGIKTLSSPIGNRISGFSSR